MKHELDATNQSFGRIASRVAFLLRGKDSPNFQEHILPNSEVVIKNLDKIKFTGNKFANKKYYRYSGYPGGITSRSLEELWANKPTEVFRKTVYDMLPKNKSRDKIIKNLKFK